MITLHESNITSFPLDNGIGVLSDAIIAFAEEELNGLFEFYMEYDSEGHLVDELKEERIIKAKAQDKLGYQLFRIYKVGKHHENDNIVVLARHITYDLANNFVESLVATNMTKKQVMEKIGSSTVEPHPFNVTSSNTTTMSSTKLYRTNPIQMIAGMDGSVLQIWGGQIERDNFNLILHDRRGHDDGVTVRYAKNLTGLTAEFDISGLVTRIFPFVYIEATDDTPERLITVSGKYIDSPHINDYEQIYIEPIDYSHDERIDTHEKTDAQIRQQLEQVANEYFEETGNDKVKATLDVNFMHLWETEEYKDVAPLELVGMGDTVTINHSRLKVDATAIVNYIKYDCIAHVNEEVRLGNVKAGLTDSLNKINVIERKVEQAESNANQAIVSANGKNTTFYGPDEPVDVMQKGDLWFELVDGQYNRTYRFDGIQWQLIVDMDSAEAKQLANEAKQDAEQSLTTANHAINTAQASFDKAQENATVIDGLGLQIGDVETGLTTISGTVQGLQTTVTDLDGNVSNLTQLSNAMQAQLKDVEGNVNTLTLTSQGMQSTISSLQDEVEGLEYENRNLLQYTDFSDSRSVDMWTTRDTAISIEASSIGGYNLAYVVIGSYEIGDYARIYSNGSSMTLTKGTTYTLSFYGVSSGWFNDEFSRIHIHSPIDGYIRIPTPKKTLVGQGDHNGVMRNIYKYTSTFTFSGDTTSGCRLSIGSDSYRGTGGRHWFYIGLIKIEKGTKATPWSPAPEDMATQSQITQLSDAINLRVVKGDVINQINLDTSGVLISGKKLILDGDTTVTGQFKVGNANIKSIDAGKVTVGDLVGHSLVGGKVIGGYIEQQSGNGRLEMQDGRIDSFYHNNLSLRLGQHEIEFFNEDESRLGAIYPVQSLVTGQPGLSIEVDTDSRFLIGPRIDGVVYPSISIVPSDRRMYIAGPYSGALTGSRLELYANRRHLSQNVDFNPIDQPAIILDQSDNTNDMTQYFGGTNRRSGAVWQVRWRESSSTSLRRLEVNSSGVVIQGDLTHSSGDAYYRNNRGGADLTGEHTLRAGGIRPITGNSHFYVGVAGEFRVSTQTGTAGGTVGYREARAAAWNNASSIEYKTDIVDFSSSALDIINDLKVVNYRLKDDLSRNIDRVHTGFISEHNPIIATEDLKAINTYKLMSLNTKAIQELDTKFTDDVEFLKLKVQYLEGRIKQLEGVA